jgi:hypothetical protein
VGKPSFEQWDFVNGVAVRRTHRPGFFLMLAHHLEKQRHLKGWLHSD